MIVQKFGGSSVGTLERVRNVAKIVASDGVTKKILVLSAMSGVTDLLLQAGTAAATRGDFSGLFHVVREKYHSLIAGLDTSRAERAEAALAQLEHECTQILSAIAALRFCETRTRDLLLSFGERMMCTLMPFFLDALGRPAFFVDARQLIVTDNRFGNARVLFEKTATKLAAWWKDMDAIPVVTGYIAATEDGISTTLDRGGSDYTATIIGGGLGAERVEIWTDVDGAMTADPRVVPEAKIIDTLSFAEAAEMAYFGAKVLHPLTLLPVSRARIPVVIKNTFRPEVKGTTITHTSGNGSATIKSIATRSGLAILNVEGASLRGQIGAAGRLFSALARVDANVIMISQASSEESICFVVAKEECARAARAVEEEFSHHIETDTMRVTVPEENFCILAVVGDGMVGVPGVAGRLFSSLGKAGVNIRAIAQGSSERNISAVIRDTDRDSAVRAVHKEFIG